MTTYVYRPICPIPTPLGPSGHTGVTVWGAGLLAVTFSIRLIEIQYETAGVIMSRVDSATMHNSSIGPTNTPINSRSGAQTCGATTALGSITTNLSGSTYSYTISGAIPSGTFNYLGLTTAGSYTFPRDTIINPGSAFWLGSNITATNISVGGTPSTLFNGSAPGSSTISSATPYTQSQASARVYFEELHLARSN